MKAANFVRPAIAALAVLAGAGALSGCVGMIDENAELDPRVLETPEIDTATESTRPRGSAAPNPYF